MTTLKDLETIIPNVIKQMEDVASAMSRYNHYDRHGEAIVLINEINGKIKQIKKVHEIYKTAPSFKNQNFDEYVKMIQSQLDEFKKLYNIIMRDNDLKLYH